MNGIFASVFHVLSIKYFNPVNKQIKPASKVFVWLKQFLNDLQQPLLIVPIFPVVAVHGLCAKLRADLQKKIFDSQQELDALSSSSFKKTTSLRVIMLFSSFYLLLHERNRNLKPDEHRNFYSSEEAKVVKKRFTPISARERLEEICNCLSKHFKEDIDKLVSLIRANDSNYHSYPRNICGEIDSSSVYFPNKSLNNNTTTSDSFYLPDRLRDNSCKPQRTDSLVALIIFLSTVFSNCHFFHRASVFVGQHLHLTQQR